MSGFAVNSLCTVHLGFASFAPHPSTPPHPPLHTDDPHTSGIVLAALPPELSVHLAGFLTLADARALALTCRATSVAAAEVLCGELAACRRLDACPDAADLPRRVGIGRLRRAWALSATRPFASLCAQLERRLGCALDAARDGPGAVPFAIATCDAPGSLMIVRRPDQSGQTTALRAAARIAADATGRPVALLPSPGKRVKRLWRDIATAAGPGAEKSDAQLLVFDLDTEYSDIGCMCGRASDTGQAVAIGHWFTHQIKDVPPCNARVIVTRGKASSRRFIVEVCSSRDLPFREIELVDVAATLAPDHWMVIDVWRRRRWHRWRPPLA